MEQNTITTCEADLAGNIHEGFAARFGPVPEHQSTAVTAYLTAVDVAALPDLFDGLTASYLDDARDNCGTADWIVRAHLEYLNRWHTALDTLDAELRNARGHHDEQSRAVIAGLSRDLFTATDTLQRAVITHHHGGAGPYLDPAYGYAYQLSNGTASPFGG